MSGDSGTYVGVGAFLAFGISVIAAVVAIDMYKLLRTGEFGASWRILIIASVIFALVQALRLAELFNWGGLQRQQLSEVADLLFVLSLAYAFYLQRRAFTHAFKANSEIEDASEIEEDELPIVDDMDLDGAAGAVNERVSRETEWARLSGRPITDDKKPARR